MGDGEIYLKSPSRPLLWSCGQEEGDPEVPFMLKKNEYPKIWHEIQRRGWEILTNPIQQVGILMVQEFYANAWITKNHDQSVNPDPKN